MTRWNAEKLDEVDTDVVGILAAFRVSDDGVLALTDGWERALERYFEPLDAASAARAALTLGSFGAMMQEEIDDGERVDCPSNRRVAAQIMSFAERAQRAFCAVRASASTRRRLALDAAAPATPRSDRPVFENLLRARIAVMVGGVDGVSN